MSEEQIKSLEVVSASEIEDVEMAVEIAEKQVDLINRIKAVSIKLTRESDWQFMGDSLYMKAEAAKKIGSFFGVSLLDVEKEKLNEKDSEGEYYIWVYTGRLEWRGRSFTAVGVKSSRDKFFGQIGGGFKQMSKVEEPNVMKSAHTNMVAKGVKSILGLEGIDQEDLKKAGLTTEKIGKVDYKKDVKFSPEDKKKQVEIANMLIEIAHGDLDVASSKLSEITAFKGKDGRAVPGIGSAKDLFGKRLEIAYSNVKKNHSEWKKGIS